MKNITKGYEIIVWKIEGHETYVYSLIFRRDATRNNKKGYKRNTSADDTFFVLFKYLMIESDNAKFM